MSFFTFSLFSMAVTVKMQLNTQDDTGFHSYDDSAKMHSEISLN